MECGGPGLRKAGCAADGKGAQAGHGTGGAGERKGNSPLSRARETARLANTYIQVPVETEPRLIEHSFGRLEGVPRTSPEFWKAKRNMTTRYPDGESVLEVAHRIYSLLDEIPQKYPGETVLLVCHGAVSRVVHTYFEDIDEEAFHHYSLGNCQLKAYELPEGER